MRHTMAGMVNVIRAQAKQPFGILGVPPGVKEQGQRTDWVNDKWSLLIESHGYRCAWLRNSKCPCSPPSSQLVTPDPVCTLCSGAGYFYFGSPEKQDLSRETFTDTQQSLMTATGAYLIRSVISSVNLRDKDYEQSGFWRYGDALATVEWNNRLAYRDRLVAIDINLVQSEVVLATADAVGVRLPLRYLASGAVFVCRSTTVAYRAGYDFTLNRGLLYFLPGREPTLGTRITVSYETFPTYVVEDMPHARRVTNTLFKTPSPQTAEGNIAQLPIQAHVRLEVLANLQDGGAG